jgi:hypothetical protein
MYVFTRDGHYSELLDMSFENAERYVIRRMAPYTPSYRVLRGYPPEYRSIEYACHYKDSKQFDTARLQLVTPVTSLEGERAWKENEEHKNKPQWERFITEANEVGDDGEGYGYYQWPWPIPDTDTPASPGGDE